MDAFRAETRTDRVHHSTVIGAQQVHRLEQRRGTRPLLASTAPFLGNLNPILDSVGLDAVFDAAKPEGLWLTSGWARLPSILKADPSVALVVGGATMGSAQRCGRTSDCTL